MTSATADLVDAEDEVVKSELRSDIAQAVSDVVIALEKQGKDFRTALERQGSELRIALERQGSELRIALERQGSELRIALERQGSELSSAIERQNTILDQRLATAAYLIFGGSAVGHLATIGVVISLVR